MGPALDGVGLEDEGGASPSRARRAQLAGGLRGRIRVGPLL